MKTLHEKYSTQGLKIIAVNLSISDPLPRVQKFVKAYQSPFTVVMDTNQTVQKQYGLRGTDWSVLVDQDGNIQTIARGVPQEKVKALLNLEG